MAQLQRFAWDAANRGMEVHLQANPSAAEMLQKQIEAKKEKLKDQVKDSKYFSFSEK
jgi:pre-mRNA-processing factor SLU7